MSSKKTVEFDKFTGWDANHTGPGGRAILAGVKNHYSLGDREWVSTSPVLNIEYGADGEVIALETINTMYNRKAPQ